MLLRFIGWPLRACRSLCYCYPPRTAVSKKKKPKFSAKRKAAYDVAAMMSRSIVDDRGPAVLTTPPRVTRSAARLTALAV